MILSYLIYFLTYMKNVYVNICTKETFKFSYFIFRNKLCWSCFLHCIYIIEEKVQQPAITFILHIDHTILKFSRGKSHGRVP